jgi:aromatic-L-amino-acid decarboxylase
LNRELLTRLQNSGEAYLSNAVIHGKFALRACIVNFRTSLEDLDALLPLIVRLGKEVDSALRPLGLRSRSRAAPLEANQEKRER